MPKKYDTANISGFDATMKALREYDTVQYKAIQKRITQAAKVIEAKARANVLSAAGLRNWGKWAFSRDGRDLSFDAGAVASTIKVTRGSGRIKRQRGRFTTNAVGVVTTDPVAQIFHTMGNAKKPGPRTSTLGESMRANFAGKVASPRGLWAAADTETPAALASIEEAVREAERLTNRYTA